MTAMQWREVPVGRGSTRWNTVSVERRVLVVVHNLTAATRLADVTALLESAFRVQLVFTYPESSPFTGGVVDYLEFVT